MVAGVTTGRAADIEIAVEREVLDRQGASRRVRLSARITSTDATSPPSTSELGEAIRSVDEELEKGCLQAGFRLPSSRPDRTREELVETYRPRQSELVDVLLSDGEITEREAELLRSSVRAPGPAAPPGPPVSAAGTAEAGVLRGLAALPLSNDRTPANARPVEELLRVYQISTLKQAGAVRARRQISYDEYMSLKHHFAQDEASAAASPGSA